MTKKVQQVKVGSLVVVTEGVTGKQAHHHGIVTKVAGQGWHVMITSASERAPMREGRTLLVPTHSQTMKLEVVK